VCEADDENSLGCGKTTRIIQIVNTQEIYIQVGGGNGGGDFDLTVSVLAVHVVSS